MIDYKEILNDEKVVDLYKKIDKENVFPFNHGMQHVLNVIELVKKISKALNISEKDEKKLLIAAALHDIGSATGRKNHASKSKEFAKSYLNEKVEKTDLNDILDIIEYHNEEHNFDNMSLLSKILLFLDKMDFSSKRVEEGAEEKFGYVVYTHVEDVDFKLENNKLSLLIITDGTITEKELLEEKNFFYKVLNSTKVFAEQLKLEYEILVDNKPLNTNKTY